MSKTQLLLVRLNAGQGKLHLPSLNLSHFIRVNGGIISCERSLVVKKSITSMDCYGEIAQLKHSPLLKIVIATTPSFAINFSGAVT